MLKIICLSLLCASLCLKVQSSQEKPEINNGAKEDPDDWNAMKWNTVRKDSEDSKLVKDSTEDPNELDVLFPLPSKPNKVKALSKLSESELKDFSSDEVFIDETKKFKKKSGVYDQEPSLLKEQSISENFPDVKEDEFEQPRNLNKEINEIFEKIEETELSNKNSNEASSNVSQDTDQLNRIPEESNFEVLGERSFIFNPLAEPQEQFQNCTTPRNETGSCKYLQHCLFPTVVSSLGQFLDYVCIIEGRFIGVCCPNLPASVVVVQALDEDIKGETELNENCGVATNTRIVGGTDADPKAWPWMVALLSKSKKRFFCGGSLINDMYVLTAAHCTFGIRNNEIIARVGEYDFKNHEGKHEEYTVVEMKRHGHYNRRNLRNDIALLKLDKPVKFNEFAQTICFPDGEKDYVGEMATLTGWGNLAGAGPTSEVLQQTGLPVITNEECSKGHGLPIPESLICTAAKAGDTGACNGDSGGPLMLLDENDRWKVIGLVSWGRRGCDPEFPTVYTRVSFFLDWIKKHAT